MIRFCGYVILSAVLIGIYRRLALRRSWLDSPNERSSHAATTPRGAGLVFALLIAGAAGFELQGHVGIQLTVMLALGIAIIGWCDDVRGGLSVRVRFLLYGLCAIIALALPYNDVIIRTDVGKLALLIFGLCVALGLVWLINLYNFMDGINGIAGTEAVFVMLSIILLSSGTPYASLFQDFQFAACAAIVGFLLWNFPAGKVFMGDAGSAFLGFLFGALMLWSALLQGPGPIVWLILLGIFIVDASYTLIIRMTTGQSWHQAHRMHAYQILTSHLGDHAYTVAVIMAVNLFWLLPFAWLVYRQHLNTLVGLSIAYAPLLWACYRLKAGIPVSGRV